MKNYFLSTFFLTALLGLLLVSVSNFILDGDALYAKKILFSEQSPAFSSPDEFAITDIQIDERLLKKQMLHILASRTKLDCAFIGSSRAMLISSIYQTAPVGCKNMINLAVSGAGVEDALLMSYYLSQLPYDLWPKQIYIDLSHWSFRFGAEESWKILKRDYPRAYSFFMNKDVGRNRPDLSLWVNILSLDYLIHSFKVFESSGWKLNAAAYKVMKEYFTPEKGPEDSAILRDGSRVYSKKQRELHKTPIISGTEEYKISTQKPDPEALQGYLNIAQFYKSYGVDVIFFAMPYHSMVVKPQSPMFTVINDAQRVLSDLERDRPDSVWGSFLIEDTPCTDYQMMDFMHPDAECIKKIMQSR